MKIQAIPSFVDDTFVNTVVTDCIRFFKRQAPWWLDQSCLNCNESKRLIQLFLISYRTWQRRQQQPAHKRKITPNNMYDLAPLVYDLAYTIDSLISKDQSYLNADLKSSIQESCDELRQYLSEWHKIDFSQLGTEPLAKVS
ncbi:MULTISPECIES: hypothetical protein [Aliagarivorans]|uniref:hypothetical protein n=1 Tax=Aliagarivorans TaxID=882379 RepID=UPI00041CB89B|nr:MULTISPECIES: hypothetical protein [Aliagarivorans]